MTGSKEINQSFDRNNTIQRSEIRMVINFGINLNFIRVSPMINFTSELLAPR